MIPKKSKVSVREISKKIAKEMIVKHHYSHAWSSCRYALGIFYETDNESIIGEIECDNYFTVIYNNLR